MCPIVGVYQSQRRANAYNSIGVGTPEPYFSMKWQNGCARLLVDMQALGNIYRDLDASSVSGQAQAGAGAGGRAQKKSTAAGGGQCLYYDDNPGDGFSPYPPGLDTPAEIRKEQRQEAKELRRAEKLQRLQERDMRRYDHDVLCCWTGPSVDHALTYPSCASLHTHSYLGTKIGCGSSSASRRARTSR